MLPMQQYAFVNYFQRDQRAGICF